MGSKRRFEQLAAAGERSWKERKYTDAEILCDGSRIAVHRATLSSASSVFDAAFSSSMVEGRHAVYEMRDTTSSAVEAMLQYIYTGIVDEGSDHVALLDLSVQYEL